MRRLAVLFMALAACSGATPVPTSTPDNTTVLTLAWETLKPETREAICDVVDEGEAPDAARVIAEGTDMKPSDVAAFLESVC